MIVSRCAPTVLRWAARDSTCWMRECDEKRRCGWRRRRRERGGNANVLRGLYFQLEFRFLHLFGLLHLFELCIGRLAGNRRISNAVRAGSEKAQWQTPKPSMGGTAGIPGGQHHRKASFGSVGNTGTIQYGMAASFPGVHGDSRPDRAMDACCGMSTHGLLVGPATSNKGCIPARGHGR